MIAPGQLAQLQEIHRNSVYALGAGLAPRAGVESPGSSLSSLTARAGEQRGQPHVVSVNEFGAVGNGVADDTAAIVAALGALKPGDALYFPAGTYLFCRGTGDLLPDTIVAGDVVIYGSGAGSIISGRARDGSIPDNCGNQYYNVFQATGRSNITVRDLAFQGYTTPVALFSCAGVAAQRITDNGLLPNPGAYLRDKSIYTNNCRDVRIEQCRFDNVQFSVYLSGSPGSRTSAVSVRRSVFEQTAGAGKFTSAFPVGIYHHYADDVAAINNTFRNIYSSVDDGTPGTGIGYGVYEGDGAGDKLLVSGNTFIFQGKRRKRAICVLLSQVRTGVVENNVFTAGHGVTAALRIDAKIGQCERTVTGNRFELGDAYGVHLPASAEPSRDCRATVHRNTFNGGEYAIRCEPSPARCVLSNNDCTGQTRAGIHCSGTPAHPLRAPVLRRNVITHSRENAILFAQYVISPVVSGNTLLDGNLANAQDDHGAAILFTSYSYGSSIVGNVIGNTGPTRGFFTYGIQNAANPADRIFKDIWAGNTFRGLSPDREFGRYFATRPSNGIFDLEEGDLVQNAQASRGVRGWYCVFKRDLKLAADASSADRTISVSSTSALSPGDVILLCKDHRTLDVDYAAHARWHADEVKEVIDRTHLKLTAGIPPAKGIFQASSAIVKIARFRTADGAAAGAATQPTGDYPALPLK